MERVPKPQWRRWGTELRRHRELAGLSQDQLARMLHVAAITVSTWERGARHPKRDRVEAVDTILCTGGALLQLWSELNRTDEVPETWRDYAKLEQQATEIREYQPMIIPGLLQTPGYIRAIIRNNTPEASDEHIKRLVETRTTRLKELTHTALSFVIEEVAARKVLGSPETHQEQMGALLHIIDERGMRVTIVPEYAPRRPVASGSFRIMTLHDGRLVGHAEHWGGQQVISTPTHVNRMVSMFGHLQAEALSHDATVDFIRRLRRGTE
jgi:transcriptional regulator with XRE-family HTH domain